MPWNKGESGNPLGRPRGIQDRRTALRAALEGRAEELLSKAVERAMEGDTAVLIALLSRLIPRMKPESPVLGTAVSANSSSDQAMRLVSAAMSGEISPSTAVELMQAIASAVKVREADEVLMRLEKLEARLHAND